MNRPRIVSATLAWMVACACVASVAAAPVKPNVAPRRAAAAHPAARHHAAGGTAAAAPRGAAALPVELVETVPVETAIGNPELRQARDVWVEMIRSARHTIDLEEFYVTTWPGEPLEPVLRALGDAVRRGVRVRMLVDLHMGATYPQPLDSLATVHGFEVRRLDMRRIAGGVQHSKYFLIDGEQVFMGSQNLDWRSLAHVHELGVRVRDARVASDFAEVFAWDWQAADTTTWTERPAPRPVRGQPLVRKLPAPPVQHALAVPLRIVQSAGDTVVVWPSYTPRGWIPDSTRFDLDVLTNLIDRARSEIVVQLLTYSLEEYGDVDSTLDLALRAAAARGVHVKLLISDWETDGKGITALQRLSQVPNIEARLSTLPPWSGGYIPFARVEHCKYLVADTARVWVGTANWSPGYFFGTRNLALTLENARLAAQARRVFEASWTAPSAAPVQAGIVYEPKVRGLKPPADWHGKVYGN